jgi:hypothetical protein
MKAERDNFMSLRAKPVHLNGSVSQPAHFGRIPSSSKIMVMFCSANPPRWAPKRESVMRYLLNPHSIDSPADMSVAFGLFNFALSKATRQIGIAGRLNFETGTPDFFSEIASASAWRVDTNAKETVGLAQGRRSDLVPTKNQVQKPP